MSLLSVLLLAGAMFVLAATPGPGVFATVARALASGFVPAAELVVGIVIGDLVYLLLAIFGLGALAAVLGELFVVVKYAGAAYLLWLGWRLWHAPPVDRDALRQALLNVLDNARKYGAAGGRVEVALERSGGACVLSVRDFGPGVPEGERALVFERFRRGARQRDGSLPGIALMTSNLLNDGAGKLSADQLAEAFESLGAQFTTSSLRDMATPHSLTFTATNSPTRNAVGSDVHT